MLWEDSLFFVCILVTLHFLVLEFYRLFFVILKDGHLFTHNRMRWRIVYAQSWFSLKRNYCIFCAVSTVAASVFLSSKTTLKPVTNVCKTGFLKPVSGRSNQFSVSTYQNVLEESVFFSRFNSKSVWPIIIDLLPNVFFILRIFGRVINYAAKIILLIE